MIAGTNANCKILKININKTTATITLLIFATQATIPAKSFRIAIKDVDTGLITYADNNSYWIDQINNYNFDSNNVDTKKYKEIMFDIDITRNNTSQIKGTQWNRNCYIYLIDNSKSISDTPAWSSDLIQLISSHFEIPEFKNIILDTTNQKEIKASFELKYNFEQDFNYNNENISVVINIRSILTDNLIETVNVNLSNNLKTTITTNKTYDVGTPVVVQFLVLNLNKKILVEQRKIYKPVNKYTNSFIKTDTGIKRIIAFFVNTDSEVEHEGEWL